jgi:hypothetical protein
MAGPRRERGHVDAGRRRDDDGADFLTARRVLDADNDASR